MATSHRPVTVNYRGKTEEETAECPVCGRPEVGVFVDRFNGKTLRVHNEARVRRNRKIKAEVRPIIYATKTRCEGSNLFIGRVSNER